MHATPATVRKPIRVQALQVAGFLVETAELTSTIGMLASYCCLCVLIAGLAGAAAASEEATLPVHPCLREVKSKKLWVSVLRF